MGDIDNCTLQLYSEEEMLLQDLFAGDYELLFLDSYLTDILG